MKLRFTKALRVLPLLLVWSCAAPSFYSTLYPPHLSRGAAGDSIVATRSGTLRRSLDANGLSGVVTDIRGRPLARVIVWADCDYQMSYVPADTTNTDGQFFIHMSRLEGCGRVRSSVGLRVEHFGYDVSFHDVEKGVERNPQKIVLYPKRGHPIVDAAGNQTHEKPLFNRRELGNRTDYSAEDLEHSRY